MAKTAVIKFIFRTCTPRRRRRKCCVPSAARRAPCSCKTCPAMSSWTVSSRQECRSKRARNSRCVHSQYRGGHVQKNLVMQWLCWKLLYFLIIFASHLVNNSVTHPLKQSFLTATTAANQDYRGESVDESVPGFGRRQQCLRLLLLDRPSTIKVLHES